jgi:signal transduction histidine kinase
MLKLKDLYIFMENNFDYLLVIDHEEKIIHTSNLFERDASPSGESLESKKIVNLVNPSSLNTFRSAMAQARAGGRGISVFTPIDDESISIPLKTGHTYLVEGEAYIFFSNKLTELSMRDEWEKEERIKELSCIYNVAEFIEVSSSINEFFTGLPRILSRGMLYPEEAVVYSEYQGIEYGQKPSSKDQISVQLVVGQERKGEIKVGYLDDKHEVLPEEQKMLDEIRRMLNLALERKEFRERLSMKQDEEEEYNEKLKALTKEIEERTKQLEEQRSNLDIVNSYLDRVKGGWEETKGRLETMFKAIPDEVVLIDKRRKVVMTNREDVVPGDYCFRSFFGREKPCEDCRLARILQDKTPVTLTMRNDDKYLQVHALPVYNQDHEVDGILEFYRDITLEKTYDQQLQQADKLASLGQLVSGIGHEINNPNQFIRGNIKIIKQSFEDILPIIDEYAEAHPDFQVARLKYDFFRQHIMTLVDDMSHGSERIKGIVEGLRTFVRKDEGLLVDTVDINTLIEASTRLVHKEVHKRADIELDLADDLPTFTGNAQKIEQVMINLIVNASEAMREDVKGLVTVRTRLDGGTIVVEVKDSGVGMNQQTIKQIFDPFFTTKRAKGGTGLGLAIAYRIIEEHGGNISVQSKPGKGTTFAIRVPAGRSKQPSKGTE